MMRFILFFILLISVSRPAQAQKVPEKTSPPGRFTIGIKNFMVLYAGIQKGKWEFGAGLAGPVPYYQFSGFGILNGMDFALKYEYFRSSPRFASYVHLNNLMLFTQVQKFSKPGVILHQYPALGMGFDFQVIRNFHFTFDAGLALAFYSWIPKDNGLSNSNGTEGGKNFVQVALRYYFPKKNQEKEPFPAEAKQIPVPFSRIGASFQTRFEIRKYNGMIQNLAFLFHFRPHKRLEVLAGINRAVHYFPNENPKPPAYVYMTLYSGLRYLIVAQEKWNFFALLNLEAGRKYEEFFLMEGLGFGARRMFTSFFCLEYGISFNRIPERSPDIYQHLGLAFFLPPKR